MPEKDNQEQKSYIALREEQILQQWDDKKIFQKTLDKESPKGNFVFFEGPPTANGRPGIHHIIARAFKDIMPRYKTMQGFHVERKGGWDTHGLPVELQVEKQLEISGKPDIEKYGVKEFNKKCKESVWQFKDEWEKLTKRIAYWVDIENPYITYKNEYIESLWWILKQVEEKGLLYKGYKVVPHCPRCGTTLSSHEVAQGYKNIEEPSVYIKFKVVGEDNTYILSWTTTPWTLPGNIGLAVGEQVDYVKVKKDNSIYILAKALVEKVLEENYEIIEEIKGSDLVGMEYEPLFPNVIEKGDKNAWTINVADFVTIEDGTGIVHTAAMYGEDDFEFGLKYNLPLQHSVGEDGCFMPSVTKWAGKFVKDEEVERDIINDLDERNLLLKEKSYEHDYPFCWRCDSPLLYYAKDSWFIKMSDLRQKLVDTNAQVNWVPAHIRDGRFGEWLKNARDWAISRSRYWGTPIPVWECADCKSYDVIGSLEDLENKTGSLPKDDEGNVDVHRPYIDDLTYKCDCGGEKKRILEVFDCWYDSGSMPFAQHHYPFENKELIDNGDQFPADYICEAIDQTRGWFYTLLAVSTVLDRGMPYKNVICLGHIRDKHGKKMSKSKGNVVDPWMIADKFGIDALRMHLYSINQPGDPKNFDEKSVEDVMRKVIMLMDNVTKFYSLYQKEEFENKELKLDNVLDKWIVAKLHTLIKEVTQDLDKYFVYEASRKIISFIDELSTWYLRRSRDRFKAEGNDQQQALTTLHYVLFNTIKVLAPFTPMFVENLYQKLHGSKESIHLEDWPTFNEEYIDTEIIIEMDKVQKIVEMVHSLRAEHSLKVRQPLQAVMLPEGYIKDDNMFSIISDEVNVKEIKIGNKPEDSNWVVKSSSASTKSSEGQGSGGHGENNIWLALNTKLTPELKAEGLVREVVRNVNNLRKKKGLTINDFVELNLATQEAELKEIIVNFKEAICKDTLCKDIIWHDSLEGNNLKVNGMKLVAKF